MIAEVRRKEMMDVHSIFNHSDMQLVALIHVRLGTMMCHVDSVALQEFFRRWGKLINDN